jgi:hypothetical protein
MRYCFDSLDSKVEASIFAEYCTNCTLPQQERRLLPAPSASVSIRRRPVHSAATLGRIVTRQNSNANFRF